jgi:dTDP-4-amino-4,6-dideoxygalactose transaminase
LPRSGPLVEADRLGRQALGLPFHTRLTAADIERIVKALQVALAAAIDRRPGKTP